MSASKRYGAAALAALGLLSLVACGDAGDGATGASGEASRAPLVVYSGRSEALVGPLLAEFRETGVEIEVRYGSTTEMAATLLEEGERTPADVFLAQDAAALGAISERGLFQPLGDAILRGIPERFRSPRGDWIGLSGRARSIVYNPERIAVEELPQSLGELTAERYRGRFGVAPTNGSFQAHMAVYSAVHGSEALAELLAGLTANEPRRYPGNSAIVEAVIAGEVDFGLVNHYYLWRALKERPGAPARNFFPPRGEASGFINIAGIGVLDRRPEALALIDFLLAERAQEYFARETFEYPLAAGVEPAVELPPLAELATPKLDFGQVSAALEQTLEQISRSGLVR